MINPLTNVDISTVSAEIKDQDLMKEQALLHDSENMTEYDKYKELSIKQPSMIKEKTLSNTDDLELIINKPMGCPQRIWNRASDSTKRILIEAARSK